MHLFTKDLRSGKHGCDRGQAQHKSHDCLLTGKDTSPSYTLDVAGEEELTFPTKLDAVFTSLCCDT